MVLGRKPKPIDWDTVDKMLIAQNPAKDIAEFFHLSADAFYRRVFEEWGIHFTNYASAKYSEGKINLRLKNFNKAMQGNVQALHKLSDVYLEEFKEEKNPSKIPEQDNLNKDDIIIKLKAELALAKKLSGDNAN